MSKLRKSKISPEATGSSANYSILRMDGLSGQGKPHENCRYFVLDLNHDPYAKEALAAYAGACKQTNVDLFVQILDMIDQIKYEELSGDIQ